MLVNVVPAVASWPRPRRVHCRGHASENPELPTSLAATPDGIRFLGPPASAMAALGDKVALSSCRTHQGWMMRAVEWLLHDLTDDS